MNLLRSALGLFAVLAVVTGCAGSQPPVAAPGAMPQSHAAGTAHYRVVFRFDAYPDGEEPAAGLAPVGGDLYGTASRGGQRRCHGMDGCGTLFALSTRGREKLLLSFDAKDGVFPMSRLTDLSGTLYGTAAQGGPYGKGTIYTLSPSGTQTLLHGFTGGTGGSGPESSLRDVHGTLYGTTAYGGRGPQDCCGTVYSITASGTFASLYHFKNGSDGLNPAGGLIFVKGALYGTTPYGGATKGGCCGTVYRISTAGDERVIYRFQGGSDGASPQGNLIDVNGTLYGTTYGGGSGACYGGAGCGTVFTITPSGQERVLYSFTGNPDGAHPRSGLIEAGGTLYGSTVEGGAGCTLGCGTIYSITTAGQERVLYSFAGGSDGMSPIAPLVEVRGTLYGTTFLGGGENRKLRNCCGTVFALTP